MQQQHYFVPPGRTEEARQWARVGNIALLTIGSAMALLIYILGWMFTYPLFDALGWFFFSWVPWTAFFLFFLIPACIYLIARYRLFRLSVVQAVPKSDPCAGPPPPIVLYPDPEEEQHTDTSYENGYQQVR